jgi:hypothetical protein
MPEGLIEGLKKNPHFKALPDILSRESMDQEKFIRA